MGSLLRGATQIMSKSSSAFFLLNPNWKLSLYKPYKSLLLLRTFGIWPPLTRSSMAASTQMASLSSPSVAPQALNAMKVDMVARLVPFVAEMTIKGLLPKSCAEGKRSERFYSTKSAKVHKGPGKSKNEKAPGAKSISPISIKKSKDGNGAEAKAYVSNGSAASNSRPKQRNKSRSFNGRQM
ncbi:hypothetical protein FF2_025191 [Malus domestica]